MICEKCLKDIGEEAFVSVAPDTQEETIVCLKCFNENFETVETETKQ